MTLLLWSLPVPMPISAYIPVPVTIDPLWGLGTK
jgi:hypothetical protein